MTKEPNAAEQPTTSSSCRIQVINENSEVVGEIDIEPGWIERKKGNQAVHDVVVAYLANVRRGTASTKTRAEVRGGGAKPWRQKGTGRARAGSNRSPIWRGGGVIFGPTPRDYSKKVNKKVRKLALKRAFTSRFDEQSIIVLDQLRIDEPKTRKLTELLKSVGAGDHALVIIENANDKNLFLSARNLPNIVVVFAHDVNVYQLLHYRKVVFTRNALQLFGGKLVKS